LFADETAARRRVSAPPVDRLPGVRMGFGELRPAAVPGCAEKGASAAVGPPTVRREPEDHETRCRVQVALGILVRGRRRE